MIYGTIACLGDSLSAGARGTCGYPEYLNRLLRTTGSQTEWAALNRGISGQTTWEILDRAPGVARELAGYPGAKWMVIWAGTNDSKGSGTDFEIWKQLYSQIVDWPRRYGIPIILCTYPEVDPKEMPAFTNDSCLWLQKAEGFIYELAAELDCKPSPIRVCDMHVLSDKLVDGVHLTDDGYLQAAVQVADVIRQNQ